MKPGEKLNALVAEHVLGWDRVHCKPGGNLYFGRPDDDYRRDFPNNTAYEKRILAYSTDVAAAWQVVEKVQSSGFEVELQGDADGWQCLFLNYPKIGRCETNTAPLAICLAALEAVEVEVQDA